MTKMNRTDEFDARQHPGRVVTAQHGRHVLVQGHAEGMAAVAEPVTHAIAALRHVEAGK